MSPASPRDMGDLMDDYERRIQNLRDMQSKMREISVTVVAPRQSVSATVTHGGDVTDLHFPTNAFRRMTPIELAAVILATMREAKDKATSEAAELLAPTLPAGLNAKDIYTGKADLGSLLSGGLDPAGRRTREDH